MKRALGVSWSAYTPRASLTGLKESEEDITPLTRHATRDTRHATSERRGRGRRGSELGESEWSAFIHVERLCEAATPPHPQRVRVVSEVSGGSD